MQFAEMSFIRCLIAGLTALVPFTSCNVPLNVESSDTARWKLAWTVNIDTSCREDSDRDVAARLRVLGTTTFRIVRPGDDTRDEVEAQDVVTSVTESSMTLRENCDSAAHGQPVVVQQPTASPLDIQLTVVNRPGMDSLRVSIGGTLNPGVVRLRMNNGEEVTVNAISPTLAPVVITVPYTSTRSYVDGVTMTNASTRLQLTATMTFLPE